MSTTLNLQDPPGKVFIFSEKEESLISKIREFLNNRDSPFCSLLLQRKSDLEVLGAVVQRSPSLSKGINLYDDGRSKETLIKKIISNGIDQVVNMPTKVILGFGFTVSYLHFWGFLVKLTFKFSELEPYKDPAEEAYSDVLFSLMAEELYRALLPKKNIKDNILMFISNELIELWDNRFDNKTQFFAPYIRTLWEARHKITPVLGTLMGVMELMQLSSLLSPIWDDFLEWYYTNFNDDGKALEEFIFDLKYEEISLLRNYMTDNLISAVDRNCGTEIISNLLGESPNKLKDRLDRYKQSQALQLYQSFLRRRQDGINRQRDHAPGPKQTLEELLLLYFINNHNEKDSCTVSIH